MVRILYDHWLARLRENSLKLSNFGGHAFILTKPSLPGRPALPGGPRGPGGPIGHIIVFAEKTYEHYIL